MAEPLNVPKIFVINLKYRTDRLFSVVKELYRFDFLDKAEIVEGVIVDTPNSGGAGIALAHKKCIELAKERGYETVIILQDDCKFLVTRDEFVSQINSFLKAEKHNIWSGLWFGSFYDAIFENPDKLYGKPFSISHDTGVLHKKEYYDLFIQFYDLCAAKFIETGDGRYIIDQFITNISKDNEEERHLIPLSDGMYVTRTKLCGQADTVSDRTNEFMCGGHELEL